VSPFFVFWYYAFRNYHAKLPVRKWEKFFGSEVHRPAVPGEKFLERMLYCRINSRPGDSFERRVKKFFGHLSSSDAFWRCLEVKPGLNDYSKAAQLAGWTHLAEVLPNSRGCSQNARTRADKKK
jgi:hypothetical protein